MGYNCNYNGFRPSARSIQQFEDGIDVSKYIPLLTPGLHAKVLQSPFRSVGVYIAVATKQ